MIIKCKMCGGDIEFTPGATYGTCEYCGSTSTIPKADDENKLNRYNRANHFRRQCEFDKAVAAYEKLLEQNDSDAEAHWGTVLSRYGIEYVEDPVTKKRIPTCHRVQMTSILADADYKAAVAHAPDAESRHLYEEQGAQIAEIQKGILSVSANEKPYDVFICYKETDENGQRTHDSQWAQDVYYGLTEQGYKVFFSRITLEDKIGREYEPYIFAALNSAKVMVVIGSKPEYFNAVWVKNEWSRYLAIMAKDRSRLLVPCYRGMDPYDLPDELSSLQSQDMGKIGFMQDLLRGIKKVLDASKKPEQPAVVQRIVQADAPAAPGVSSLLDRAYLFMEDGDFESADEYLNRVLDIDPRHAPAYAAKVCVTFQIRKEADLANATFQFEDNADWQKALRFADPQQKAVYEEYATRVKERVAIQIRNYAYDCAVEMAAIPCSDRNKLDDEFALYKASCTRSFGNRANGNRRLNYQRNEATFNQAVRTNEPGDVSERSLKTAAGMFDAIKDDEADEAAKHCRLLAEQAKQKAIYTSAITMRNKERKYPSSLEKVAQMFMSIPDYKDAKDQAQYCVEEAESIRAGLYSDAVNAMNAAGSESGKWNVAKKKLREYELNEYRDVETLRIKAAKRFDECLAAEKDAKQREEDAKQREEERLRRQAEAVAEKKKRITTLICSAVAVVIAAVIFVTQYAIPKGLYNQAEELLRAGSYEAASEKFIEVGNYFDAPERSKEPYYVWGMTLYNQKQYVDARAKFEDAEQYKDAQDMLKRCTYDYASMLYADGKSAEAISEFGTILGYQDATAKYEAINYEYGMECYNNGDYASAIIPLSCSGQESGEILAEKLRASFMNRIVLNRDDVFAIKNDGTVSACGNNEDGLLNIETWRDIVKIAPGTFHTVGLRKDGTLVVLSDSYVRRSEPQNMEAWKNVTDVVTCHMTTIALHSDGTCSVYSVDNRGTFPRNNIWSDIVQIDASQTNVVGLRSDGTVAGSGLNISNQLSGIGSFTNVKSVITGTGKIVGLTEDGRVLYSGSLTGGQEEAGKWSNIKKLVDSGSIYMIGLKKDGTVIATEGFSKDYGDYQYSPASLNDWYDIVDVVSNGGDLIIGLKKDGTVVFAGQLYQGLASEEHNADMAVMKEWRNVIAVYAAGSNVVALCADGTILYTGGDSYGQKQFLENLRLW